MRTHTISCSGLLLASQGLLAACIFFLGGCGFTFFNSTTGFPAVAQNAVIPAVEENAATASHINCHLRVQLLNEIKERTYSQYFQDGVLREIFKLIGTTNKHAVEFGFGYKRALDLLTEESFNTKAIKSLGLNTLLLRENGWNVTYFDAKGGNARVNVHRVVLTMENIAKVFADANIPLDVDYVSIDVDSIDVWLLLGLLKSSRYRPRVISMEFNPNFNETQFVTVGKKWAPWRTTTVFGASAATINLVGEMQGYQTVAMETTDMFLVRKDILYKMCTPRSLPSFSSMVQKHIPKRLHRPCRMDDDGDGRRFVDFPLALIGNEDAARAVARQHIAVQNEYFKGVKQLPVCW